MNSLASFPKELLLDILHYHPSSAYVITLWKTGDRLLQHKLENSVTSITLEDKSKLPASKWPSCLSRFQRLRTLSLTLVNGSLCGDKSSLHKSLLGLPLELEELTIVSQDSLTSSTEPPLDPNAPNFARLRKLVMMLTKSSAVTQAEAFFHFLTRNVVEFNWLPNLRPCPFFILPALEEAHIPPAAQVLPIAYTRMASLERHLPPSATSIPIIIYGGWLEDFDFAAYKPVEFHLTHLSWTAELAKRCPPTATSLSLKRVCRGYNERNPWTKSLPRNLTRLEAPKNSIYLSSAKFLPESLTDLTLLCAFWNGDDPLLPLPNLTRLHVMHDIGPHFISALPPSLTSVRLYGSYERCLPAFPDSVTDLHLDHAFNCPLPPNLTKLTTPRLYTPRHTRLPATLTTLNCDASLLNRDANIIASNVTSLTLKHFSVRLFPLLPHGLTSLVIAQLATHDLEGEVQVRAWSKLPTSLTSLKIKNSMPNTFLARSLTPLTELRTLRLQTPILAQLVKLLQNGHFLHLQHAYFKSFTGFVGIAASSLPKHLKHIKSSSKVDEVTKYIESISRVH